MAHAFVEMVTLYPVQAHLSSAWLYLLYCLRLPKGGPIDLAPYIADVVDNFVRQHTGHPEADAFRFNNSLLAAVQQFVAHQLPF